MFCIFAFYCSISDTNSVILQGCVLDIECVTSLHRNLPKASKTAELLDLSGSVQRDTCSNLWPNAACLSDKRFESQHWSDVNGGSLVNLSEHLWKETHPQQWIHLWKTSPAFSFYFCKTCINCLYRVSYSLPLGDSCMRS